MSLQNVILSVLVCVALALGVYAVTRPQPQQTPPVGAVSTNQPSDPFYFQGGLTSTVKPFQSTTTIACEIQNPSLTATSTFTFRYDIPLSTTTTTVFGISTSTNVGRFATSTSVLTRTIAAGTKGSDSYVGANSQNILGPGEWVQLGYTVGTTLPTVAQQQTGVCSATFFNIR